MEMIWEMGCEKYMQAGKIPEKIGILGGTYDPVHLGHTDMAVKILNEFSLDCVYLMASGDPPHKSDITAAEHRLNMLYIASKDIRGIKVSEAEIGRKGKIYTVDTLKLLKEQKKDAVLSYIIGADTVFELETWKDYKTVLKLVKFICIDRIGINIMKTRIKAAELKEKFGADICFSRHTGMDVSSSLVRKKLAKGEDVSSYLAPGVKEYIELNGLYK